MAVSAEAAEPYVIDGAHTQVLFKINRFGLSFVYGSFRDIGGEILLDEDNPENSSVTATIAVDSFSSDDDTREGHVKGELWLDAAQFPEITFTSTKVEQIDETHAKVTGDLSVHGVTRPVTLDVTLVNIGTEPSKKRKAVGFSAHGALNRHDFGVTTAEKLIGADVEIFIEALGVAPE
jgi:polyisoprenoid-binding protein YceI